MIDFSVADATDDLLVRLAPNTALVTGVTGPNPRATRTHRGPGAACTGFRGRNFSLGVALLDDLARRAAKVWALTRAEIFETHHRRKVDAPAERLFIWPEPSPKHRNCPGPSRNESEMGTRGQGDTMKLVLRRSVGVMSLAITPCSFLVLQSELS